VPGDNGREFAGTALPIVHEDSVMIDQARALVEKQVRRVRLRLFMQVVVESVALGWALGFLLAMCWFLLRPFAFAGLGDAVRWSVPAALLGLGTIAGLLLAWRRRPDRVRASLSLDERFGLQERVTTFLTLSADQIDTPAARALLKDVTIHLTDLPVTSAFPLRLAWRQLLVPGGAFALALLACVLDPLLGDLKFASQALAAQPRQEVDVKEIQQQLDALKKTVKERSEEKQAKSEELKNLEKEFQKLLEQPLDMKNAEKIRERINEFRNLEDKMKERADGLKDKNAKTDALRKQLEKLGLDKDQLAKDGPSKDFEDALRNGNLDKAKLALQKLMKDLKDDKLNPQRQKELAAQFKKLQDQMQKLIDNDDFMKKLKKDLKHGNITKEELAREMENFKHLQDLTDLLGECKECLGRADAKEAGEGLDKLLKRFGEIELSDAEVRDLLRDQDEIDNARALLMEALGDDGFGDGTGNPGGRRPIDPNDPNSKISPERSRAQVDAKGQQRVTGYARGGTFNKIPAKAVEGAFRQAVQDAPEALDRQRIPDDARAITRDYFKNLENQK
jgi:hypothetical protein